MRKVIVVLLCFSLLGGVLTAQEESETTEPDDTQAEEDGGDEPAGEEDGADEPAGDEPGSAFSFGLDLGLGVQSFDDGGDEETVTYQSLSLFPDFGFGRFGLGLDLSLNYRFTGGNGNDEFEVREEDWVPQKGVNFFELYLPKIRYLRYGAKGDPFFALFGSYSNARLGNGFLVSDYSNEQYVPGRRQFGLQLDFDGAGVDFPYFGVETFVSNVASFDLFGTRLFARPLTDLSVPLLPELQVGGTVVVDNNPAYHAEKNADSPYYKGDDPPPLTGLPKIKAENNVLAYGFDLSQPILHRELLSLTGFGDIAFQNEAVGGMIGAGGTTVGILDYNLQLRILGDNFIPAYFDTSYDLRRIERYIVYDADETLIEGHLGWYGRLGLNILRELLLLQLTMSGPLEENTGTYPELQGLLRVNPGLVPYFSLEAFYRKFYIRRAEDVVDPENAIIGARLSYESSPVIISLTYNLRYDPYDPEDRWKVTSGLQSTISLY